jgi:hypothetical protein
MYRARYRNLDASADQLERVGPGMAAYRSKKLIPAPEQHESAYLLPENAVDGGVVFGI